MTTETGVTIGEDLQREADLITGQSQDLEIKTEFDYLEKNHLFKRVDQFIKQVKAKMKPIKEATKKAHTEAVQLEKDLLKIPLDTKAKIQSLILEWDKKKRAEIEQQEKERQKALKEHEEETLEIASMAAMVGDLQEVARTMEAPAPVVKVDEVPAIKGNHYRDNWTYEIVDESKISVNFKKFVPDLDKIKKTVKELKADASIDGIRIFNKKTLISRN